MTIYTLEDLLSKGDDYAKRLEDKLKFNKEVKSKIRHKIINSFEDFTTEDQLFLIKLKEKVFNNNDIYVFGSRINGTYLSNEEYLYYKDKYSNVKESDWDIRSFFKPTIQIFENYKIDYSPGSHGIKV